MIYRLRIVRQRQFNRFGSLTDQGSLTVFGEDMEL